MFINTSGSIILMNYSYRSRCWLLKEYDKGGELYTRKHLPTIDPVKRKVWEHKVVSWGIICGTQWHEYPYWWFPDHGDKRSLFLIWQKKLNTKSSNEAELVGVDNVLTQVIWNQYFLKEQGYAIHEKTIYQDKQSAIKLENKGRWSSSNRIRRIKKVIISSLI